VVWNRVGRVPTLMALESWNSRLCRTRKSGEYRKFFLNHDAHSLAGAAKYRWFSTPRDTIRRAREYTIEQER
jgi:hypothetical protein